MTPAIIKQYNDRLICCPYDPKSLVPISFTIVGFLFFHIAAFGCKTFQTNTQSTGTFYSNTIDNEIQLGYWSVFNEDFGGCLRYSNDRLGSIWKFGRFLGIFGSLLAWVVFASTMLTSCFRYPNPRICFLIISIFMGILALISILLLLGLTSRTFPSSPLMGVASSTIQRSDGTNNSLSLSAGGVLAIISALSWVGGALLMNYDFMTERVIVPVLTRPVSRNAGPSYPPSRADINEPDNEEHEIVFLTENAVDNDAPTPTVPAAQCMDATGSDVVNDVATESPVVDTHVERTADPNGNETVITTTTTLLPDGSKCITKIIESVEAA